MKKIICLLLIFLISVSFFGCGNKKPAISWDMTPEEFIEAMKDKYEIREDYINDSENDGWRLVEFNMESYSNFENLEEAEIECTFNMNDELLGISVYDEIASDAYDVENLVELATKYWGEPTVIDLGVDQETFEFNKLYYWDDGNSGAYINTTESRYPCLNIINLNNPTYEQKFHSYIEEYIE